MRSAATAGRSGDPTQQTNSQSQAGAASQVVINLIFMTHDGTEWTVQPVLTLGDRQAAGQGGPPAALKGAPGAALRGSEGMPSLGVEVDPRRGSNAQGQGLTVETLVGFAEAVRRGVGTALRFRKAPPPGYPATLGPAGTRPPVGTPSQPDEGG